MKSQFAHYKNRATGFGMRGLAVMLCFVMLLTAIGAGTMMTAFSAKADLTGSTAIADTAQKVVDIANSVDTEADDGIIPKITKKITDLADTGAKADLAETGDTTYYLHYDNDDNVKDSTHSAVTMGYSGGIYYGKASMSSGSNWYATISSESTGSNLNSSNVVLTSSTTVAQGTNITFPDGANVLDRQSIYVVMLAVSQNGTHDVYFSYDTSTTTITVSTTQPSGYTEDSGSGSGGGSTPATNAGMGTAVDSSSDLYKVLNETDVMFYAETYCKDYNGNTHKSGLTDGNFSNMKDSTGFISEHEDDNYRRFYMQISKAERASYYYITHGGSSWAGNANVGIKTSLGGEYYGGRTINTTAATTATTTIASSYKFYQTMSISTTPNAAKTSFGSDLKIRYYINDGTNNTGSNYYYLDSIGDKAAVASTAMASAYNLSAYPVGNYTLVTVGFDDYGVYYILDKDNFTITGEKTLTTRENQIIFNLNSAPKNAYTWGGDTGEHTLTNLTYSGGRYISYYSSSNMSTNAIAHTGDNISGTNKLTGDISPSGDYPDGIRYYYNSGNNNSNGTFGTFTHIGGALTAEADGAGGTDTALTNVINGGNVTITNALSGTLYNGNGGANKAKINYYVVAPGSDTAALIGSADREDEEITYTPSAIGTYKVFAYVSDMWGYETAITNMITFDVIAAVKYKVTATVSPLNTLGTVSVSPKEAYPGRTIMVTVAENAGDFASIAATSGGNAVALTTITTGKSYSFTMPAGNVTVTGTFTEYSGTSEYYYNSYNTDGSVKSGTGVYGVQMSSAKIDGSEYSYVHVNNRSSDGSTQLFTISKNTPCHTSSEVFFTRPSSFGSDWGNSATQYVQFQASDGKVLGTVDWSGMTGGGSTDGGYLFKYNVPWAAKYVLFKDGTTQHFTQTIDLTQCARQSKENGFYLSGKTEKYGEAYKVTWYKRDQTDGIGVAGDFNEYFYSSTLYTGDFNTKGFGDHNSSGTYSHQFTKPSNLGDDSDDYYILYLYKGNTYTFNGVTKTLTNDTVIWMPELPQAQAFTTATTTKLYAKDGSIVIDWDNKTSSGATTTSGTAYGYAIIADSKILDADSSDQEIGSDHNDDGSSYETADLAVEDSVNRTFKIKTTISDSYKNRYYVRGWCINGITYKTTGEPGVNSESDGSDGVYTMTYTIPAGTADQILEITPIYYIRSSANVSTITFTLEGYDESLQEDGWGNTPYIYPFYSNNNNVDNAFGVYPGQPMVYAGGKYSIEIPIVNYLIDSSRTLHNKTNIKGITISNGYADHVHRNLIYKWSDADNDAAHKQTYDFDDFYKIYNEKTYNNNGTEKPNSIIFRIKNETDTYNRDEWGKSKINQFPSSPDTSLSSADITTIAGQNGWEILTNRYNEPVDIFGNKITDATYAAYTDADYASSNALHVISTGYNANIAGDYGTAWQVYNTAGALVTDSTRKAVPPSIFLLNNESSFNTTTYPDASHSVDGVGSYTDSVNNYKDIYNKLNASSGNNAAVGKPVFITYEQNTQDTRKDTFGTGAYRLDGRWFYTFASDFVQSKIIIEYYDNARSKWVEEASYTNNVGDHTGCSAYFTDTNTRTSNSIQKDMGNFNFTASHVAGWQFDSWQIKYGENSYQKITGATENSGSTLADANDTIVARFVPVTTGDLRIYHKVDTESTGQGTVGMSVTVNGGGEQQFSDSISAAGSIYIPDTVISNSHSDWEITVTLTATGTLDDTFDGFNLDAFNTVKASSITTNGSVGTSGYSFTFPISALYEVSEQVYKVLNYTSTFTAADHFYEINYSYPAYDTVNNGGTYTVRGKFSSSDYTKYIDISGGTRTLKESFIVGKKPHESIFNKAMTLDTASATQTYSEGKHVVNVNYVLGDSVSYDAVFSLPYAYYMTGATDPVNGTKEFTAIMDNDNKVIKSDSSATVTLTASYGDYFTSDGTQTSVSKDPETENHTGNKFVTAPKTIYDSTAGKYLYFNHWAVKSLSAYNKAKTAEEKAAVPELFGVYYNDFHYRAYGNYFITPVYDEEMSFAKAFEEQDLAASILYLGDSRNQWNSKDAVDAQTDDYGKTGAGDKIYNDFAVAFANGGTQINTLTSDKVEMGIIIERIYDNEKSTYVTGSSSINDMSEYKTLYDNKGKWNGVENTKTQLEASLEDSSGNTKMGISGKKYVLSGPTSLNYRNRAEISYYFYSQYGQVIDAETTSISFKNDSADDNYVYRAYSYIIDKSESVWNAAVSDPSYFSMKFTSSL